MKSITVNSCKAYQPLLLTLILAGLSSCNSGQLGSPTTPMATDTQAGLPLSVSLGGEIVTPGTNRNSLTLLSQEEEPFQKLPELQLGYGFDPKNNSIKVPQGYDATRLLEVPLTAGLEPTSIIIDEGSEYSDFARYSGNSDSKSSQDKMEWKAGVGASYGLYSASIKAGYAAQEDSAKSNLSINKSAGVVNQYRQHLILDDKEAYTLSQKRTASIAEALMNGVGGLRYYIEAIRSETNPQLRKQAIQQFYTEMGTHAITSVTRAYVGYHQVSLKHKMDSGQSGETKAGEFSLSSPFVNGSASYSDTSAKAFKKTAWEFSSSTKTVPANASLLTALKNVYSEMDKEMSNYDTVIDIGNLTKPIDESKLPKLDFSSLRVEKSAEEIEKISQQKTRNMQMEQEFISLDNLSRLINAKIVERDNTQDPAQTATLTKDIVNASVGKTAPLVVSLAKFLPDNMFGNLALSKEQRQQLTSARVLQEQLALNCMANADTIKQAEKQLSDTENKLAQAHKTAQEQANATAFSAWLKNTKYPAVVANQEVKPLFADWFTTQSSTQIIAYHKEWTDYMTALGLTDLAQNGNNNLQLAHNNSKLKLVDSRTNGTSRLKASTLSAKSRASTEEVEGKPVVVDFGIVPWSAFFPELLETTVDDLPAAIQVKMIQEINGILEDRSYLRLVSQFDKVSPNLNNLYSEDKDMELALVNLITMLKKAQYDFNKVNYVGKSYDLTTEAGAEGITQQLEAIRKSSKMLSSDWYKKVLELKKKGLLSPLGMLMATGSANKKNLSIYSQYEDVFDNNDGTSIYTFSPELGLNSATRNAGQQLASNLLAHLPQTPSLAYGRIIKTFIPLVFLGNSSGGQVSFMSSDKIVIDGADLSRVQYPLTLGESHVWENNSKDVSYAVNRAAGKMDSLTLQGTIGKTIFLTPSKYLLQFAGENKYASYTSWDKQTCGGCIFELSSVADLFYATRLNENVFYSMSTQLTDNQLKTISPRFTIFHGNQGNNATTKFINSVF